MKKFTKLLSMVLIAILLVGCIGTSEEQEDVVNEKNVIMCTNCGGINPNRNGIIVKYVMGL